MYSDDDDSDDEPRRVITIRPRQTASRRNAKTKSKETVPVADYKKEQPSVQDKISANPVLLEKTLQGYERILPSEYAKMENGTFIRYVVHGDRGERKIRLGGYLIKNGFPDYWVLKSGSGKRKAVTWSVPLKAVPRGSSTTSTTKPNDYYRRENVLYAKDDKVRYGAQVFDKITSGEYTLIRRDLLENIAGHAIPSVSDTASATPRRRKKVVLKHAAVSSTSDDEEEPAEPRRRRLRGNFRDDD